MDFNFASLLQGLGNGLSNVSDATAGGGGGRPGMPAQQGGDPTQAIMQILAGAALGTPQKPGPVKTIFSKSARNQKLANKNAARDASLNNPMMGGGAPGFDTSGASIPGITAGMPGPPAALSGGGGSDNDSDD